MELSAVLPAVIDDAIRLLHLMAVAIGLGASFVADISVLHRLKSPLTQTVLDGLHTYHRIVSWALIAMWISGGVLVYLRTGFILDNFSPKLIAKIVVVSVLSINSLMINVFVMSKLNQSVGTAPVNLAFDTRLRMSLVAGISTCSWLLALALGSSAVLKQSGADVQIILLGGAYLTATVISIAAATLIGRQAPRVAAR